MHENEDSFNAYQENKEDLDNAYSIYTEKGKPKKMGWSIASMILGILSLILTSFGWVVQRATELLIAAISKSRR